MTWTHMARNAPDSFTSIERSYIKAGAFCGLAELLEADRGVFEATFQEVGLSLAALTEPDQYVSVQSFGAALQRLAVRLDKPSLGLEWAAWSRPYFPQLGPMMLAGADAATLNEWIDITARYWPCHTNAYRTRLVWGSGRTEVAYRFEPSALTLERRQFIEHLAALTSLAFETLTGIRDNKHVIVRFRHARPVDTTPHESIFNCPIEFNAPRNEIVLASAQLQLPIVLTPQWKKNCAMRRITERIAESAEVHSDTVSARVAVGIQAMLGVGFVNLQRLAECMNFSAKTLQRRLAEEGASYGEILDEVRRAKALRLLAETELSMCQISSQLDYSSAPAFNAAFRRWANMPPRAFRQSSKCANGGKSPIGPSLAQPLAAQIAEYVSPKMKNIVSK